MCWIWPGDWGCIGDSLTSELPGREVSNDNAQASYFSQGWRGWGFIRRMF
jgi:hypothetical protein